MANNYISTTNVQVYRQQLTLTESEYCIENPKYLTFSD